MNISQIGSRLRTWIDAHATWLCLSLTLMGAALRLYDLGARSVWFDEAIEVLIAREPISRMPAIGAMWFYADPPLYSWLLHFTLKLGSSDFVMRLPSALFGTLAVFAGYYLFRLWVDAPGALTAQALFSLAPMQVYYSQEVNQYSLMAMLAVLIYWSFERAAGAAARPSASRLVVLGVCCALGLLAHYGLSWLIAALAIVALLRVKPADWLHWWPAIIPIGLAAVVLLVLVAWPQFRAMQFLFPASAPQATSVFSLEELRRIGVELLRTVSQFADAQSQATGYATITTWLFCLVFLIGLGVILIRPSLRPIAALLLLPLLTSYVANRLNLYFWGTRYLLFVSPLFYLAVALGLGALGRLTPALRVLPFLAAFALLIHQVYPGWPNQDPGEQLRPVIQYVQAHRQPADGLYVYYAAEPAFRVYYTGSLDAVKIGVWFRNQPLLDKLADITPFLQAHPHTWLIASHIAGDEVAVIARALETRCSRVDAITQSNAVAIKFDCTAIAHAQVGRESLARSTQTPVCDSIAGPMCGAGGNWQ